MWFDRKSNMGNIKVLLIIPAYNEEKNILNTYNDVIKYNKENNTSYDCIVINDCSTDNTKKILEENNIPHIDLIHNLGIGGAVQTGYKYAYNNNYDIAVQYDGDGQHDVSYIKNIIEPIMNNEADFVIGSRFIKKLSKFRTSASRRMGIKILSLFIKMACGSKVYDTTSGFRAVNKEIIKIFSESYPTEYPEPITTVEVIKRGFRFKEVAVNMKERTGGKSSIHAWKNVYYMLNVCLSIVITGTRRFK